MKARYPALISLFFLLRYFPLNAATLYVSVSSTNPSPPYTNWDTAATDIQAAVDCATDGDLVLVTNGIYNTGARFVTGDSTTNRVAITKALRIQSVNGPTSTVIQGYQVAGKTNANGSFRCVYLTANSTLAGFTLTGGATQTPESSGGGAMCRSTSAVISNCFLTDNTGGFGAGAAGGTLLNCTIVTNYATDSGGGVKGSILTNCIVAWNSALGDGGGADGGQLANCILASNYTIVYPGFGGGGGAYQSLLNGCIIISNITAGTGGGLFEGTANNCKIIANRCLSGSGGGATGAILNNCQVIGNMGLIGGGVGGGTAVGCLILSNSCPSGSGAGVDVGALYNSIIRYNFNTNAPGIENNYAVHSFSHMSYCCSVPLPSGAGGAFDNITNDPAFINLLAGDYRLQSNSPCINSGANAYVATEIDLDGNPRVSGGTVDIGPYEYKSPSSVLSYAWAQRYGIQTDGSADFADNDQDGMNNWQEWISGTIPTDPTSLLKIVSLTPSFSNTFTVTWDSVTNRTYYVTVYTNVIPQLSFPITYSNIAGQPGTTSFTDKNSPGANSAFYRVGVQ